MRPTPIRDSGRLPQTIIQSGHDAHGRKSWTLAVEGVTPTSISLSRRCTISAFGAFEPVEPVLIDDRGNLLAQHSRIRICLLSGLTLADVVACGGSIGDPASYDPASGQPRHDEPAGADPSTAVPGGPPYAGGTAGPGVPAANSGNAKEGWPKFATGPAAQLRRLTSEQYVASAQTLLGVSADGMPPIERISAVGGFSAIGASTVSVSGVGVGQFEAAAIFLARASLASEEQRQKLSPCTPSGVDDSVCFESFVNAVGQKAFRRPLAPDEVDRYVALTTSVATATADPWQGLEATVSAFLQSPSFLYLAELGVPDPTSSERYRYSAYEMASRLSYFLSNNAPDETLIAAASSDELLTSDGIKAQVARLLSLPSARDAVRSFFVDLLALDNLDTLSRPVEVFPKYTRSLGPAMKRETELVIEDLVFTRDGDYRHLFDQPETFVNDELAAFYGVTAPSGSDFAQVMLPASAGRVGLLGQAGVLAARDHSDGTSPTKRGLFVLTRLLCQNLPLMPPADLVIPPPPSGLITARERLSEHASSAVCGACHQVTDPVGLSLEHFDAMGAYRERDHDLDIDDTGAIGGKAYRGELELGALLRDHPALGPCLIQALYGVAVGRLASDFDLDTFASLVQSFDDDGGRIRALLTQIAASDGFRYLPAPTGN